MVTDTASAASTGPERAEAPAAGSPLPPVLYVGFAIASIGGPLALPTLFPGAAGDGAASAALVVALALLVFAVPLGVWLAYSGRIVSPGGLTAFVEAAAGRRVAVAHGWTWAVAYFLYLPYTVTFVVYDLLAPIFPGIAPYRGALELALPVALVLAALAPLRAVLTGMAVLAAAQVGLMPALGGVLLTHVGARFAEAPAVVPTGRAVGGTALLFVCASLPLYLGSEVRGGARTVRRGLVGAVAIVGVLFLFVAIPLGAAPGALRDAAIPGAAVAQAYGGRGFAVAVGLLTAGSTLALIVAEYLALARLLHWMHGVAVQTALGWIAVPFVVADAVSLIDPERFYADLLRPSLVALFLAQLVVFAVFPRFRRGALSLGAATIASALACYGLYTVLASGVAT